MVKAIVACHSVLETMQHFIHVVLNKKQLVSRSSTEAEIQALDQAVVEVEWLRWLLHELGYAPTDPTIVFQDNMS